MEKEEGFYIMNPNKVLGKVLECLGFKRVYRPLLHKTRILCLVKNTFYQFKDIVQLADYMEKCKGDIDFMPCRTSGEFLEEALNSPYISDSKFVSAVKNTAELKIKHNMNLLKSELAGKVAYESLIKTLEKIDRNSFK